MAKALSVRHEMYNRQMEEIDKREKNGVSLVIRPGEPLGISRTENDPDELERVYQMGRKKAEELLDEVKEFLSVHTVR